MKDLYKRIGLGGHSASESEIRKAILRTGNSPDALAAEAILLQPDRKRVYDNNRAQLRNIGQLRANLGLADTQYWRASACGDFDMPPSSNSPVTAGHSGKYGIWSRPLPGWLGAAIVILVVAGFFVSIAAVQLQDDAQSGGVSSPQWQNKESGLDPKPRGNLETRHPREESTVNIPHPVVGSAGGKSVSAQLSRESRIREFAAMRCFNLGLSDSEMEALTQMLLQSIPYFRPETGLLSKSFSGQGFAPLEVVAGLGADYYIKVVDTRTKSVVASIYLRGGQQFKVLLPTGSYELRYASGTRWFGASFDFGGPDHGASYARANEVFVLRQTARGYEGYTVELISRVGGNLSTDRIPAQDF